MPYNGVGTGEGGKLRGLAPTPYFAQALICVLKCKEISEGHQPSHLLAMQLLVIVVLLFLEIEEISLCPNLLYELLFLLAGTYTAES